MWAIQQTARNIRLEHSDRRSCVIQAEFSVTSLALDQSNLVLSNGRCISTYTIEKEIDHITDVGDRIASSGSSDSIKSDKAGNQLHVKILQTFNAECLALGLRHQNVFCLTTIDVTIFSIGGVILHKIISSSTEGKIIGMDLTGSYLSIFTLNGYLKAYDISRHDPRILFPSKSAFDLFEDFGEVIVAKCNAGGSHLSLVIANRSFVPKPVLYCWDFEKNHLMDYDCRGEQKSVQDSCIPVSLWWDEDEPRLMAMEIKSMKTQSNEKTASSLIRSNGNDPAGHYIESNIRVFFYSENNKLIVLEEKDLEAGEQLLNICIPNMVRRTSSLRGLLHIKIIKNNIFR